LDFFEYIHIFGDGLINLLPMTKFSGSHYIFIGISAVSLAFSLVCSCSPNGEGITLFPESRASRYLRETTRGSSFYSGSSLDRYYSEMRRFYSRPDAEMFSQYAFQDSLFATGEFFPDLEKHYDRDCISQEYISHRVNDALEQWRISPFARELDFKDFCDFLLPYRIGSEEPEEWWTDYRATFGSVLDSVAAVPGITLAEFCDAVSSILPVPHRSYTGYPSNKPSGKPSSLKRIYGGTCQDYLGLTTYLCRSYGIPVTTDYTPQWGNHSQGHQWSAIIQGDSTYHFMIGEPLFLAREKPFTFRLAKAYRKMPSVQRRYPGKGSSSEDLPASLRNPRTLDVTRYYTDVIDLKFGNLKEEGRTDWMTLNVFNDVTWSPVAGARRRGRKVVFRDVALKCVYLPMYYRNGVSVPATWPVLVGKDRSVRELIPNLEQLETVHLTRKFMDTIARQRADSLLGGRFELADNADFNYARSIPIPDKVGMNFQTAEIADGKSYRYVRYIPASGTSGNIAEIELYDRDGKQLTGGKIIGTYKAADKFHPMENVFDGDVLSYASCSPNQKEMPWVGMDLGRSVYLSRLCYLPRNDDNFIREGEEYELCYWNGEDWSSLGRQTGCRATQELVYENVPANALLLLHNHTKGKEERIFTYEGGRQIWW